MNYACMCHAMLILVTIVAVVTIVIHATPVILSETKDLLPNVGGFFAGAQNDKNKHAQNVNQPNGSE